MRTQQASQALWTRWRQPTRTVLWAVMPRMLAGEDAYLDLLDSRHVYPAGDDEDAALITVPFRLRLQIQTVAGTGAETLTTSYEVQR